MEAMTKQDRLKAAISGAAVDRPPIALWRHWPSDDQRADDLAWTTLNFQKQYDFDFIKIGPSSNYCLAGYGQTSQWLSNDEGTRVWGERIIQTPEDWLKLKPLDPNQGIMGEVAKAVHAVGQSASNVPFIPTIFNPLAQAKNLAGDNLLPHLRLYPEAVKTGLATITESTLRFIEVVKPSGMAGIFLALQHATYNLLTEAEYKTFGLENDLRLLEATGGWFNVLHLHGVNVMFDLVATYPVQVINWHDQETPPSLVEGQARFAGAVCGGLRQWETMVRGTPEAVRAEVKKALAETGGKRFIVGTGCVTPITAPTSHIRAARQAVEEAGGI
jgi:uroporphyrinogen decarboxylase